MAGVVGDSHDHPHWGSRPATWLCPLTPDHHHTPLPAGLIRDLWFTRCSWALQDPHATPPQALLWALVKGMGPEAGHSLPE